MRMYLDACCLNRPFDDQSQDRIHLEAEAVLLILAHVESGDWDWVGSEVLEWEIALTPDEVRRSRVQLMLSAVSEKVLIGPEIEVRAEELERQGIHAFDALHLAAAESAGVDIFMTTDDRLLRAAKRLSDGGQLALPVANPLLWLQENST